MDLSKHSEIANCGKKKFELINRSDTLSNYPKCLNTCEYENFQLIFFLKMELELQVDKVKFRENEDVKNEKA